VHVVLLKKEFQQTTKMQLGRYHTYSMNKALLLDKNTGVHIINIHEKMQNKQKIKKRERILNDNLT